MDRRKRGHGLEAGDEARVDGRSGFSVELLIDDRFSEGLERRLLGGQASCEWTGASNQPRQFRVGSRERGGGHVGVVR